MQWWWWSFYSTYDEMIRIPFDSFRLRCSRQEEAKKCDKKIGFYVFRSIFSSHPQKKIAKKFDAFLRTLLELVCVEKKYIEKCKSEGGVEITRKKSHEGWGWTRDSGWAAHRQLVPRPGGKNSFVSLDSPPLRSHTTRTVANVICFIHRPCVCVRIGKKLIRWMEQKNMFCYVMDFAVISRLYIFYGFTLNAVDFSHFQETFHLLDSISTPGETALCAPSTLSGWIPSATFRYFTLGRTPWEFKCFYVKI